MKLLNPDSIYSSDLIQGGLDVSCHLTFTGTGGDTSKKTTELCSYKCYLKVIAQIQQKHAKLVLNQSVNKKNRGTIFR